MCVFLAGGTGRDLSLILSIIQCHFLKFQATDIGFCPLITWELYTVFEKWHEIKYALKLASIFLEKKVETCIKFIITQDLVSIIKVVWAEDANNCLPPYPFFPSFLVKETPQIF